MTGCRLVLGLLFALAVGGLPATSDAAGAGRAHDRSSDVTIVVQGVCLRVSIRDPLGRVTTWDGENVANGIPGCDAQPEVYGPYPPELGRYTLRRAVRGTYRLCLEPRADSCEAIVWAEYGTRIGCGGEGAETVRLTRGATATWSISWSPAARTDTCWVQMRRVPDEGAKRRACAQ